MRPEGVRHIRNGAFMDCPISRIALPETLAGIGEKAFDGCRLRNVRIPGKTAEIAENAFPRETRLIRAYPDIPDHA